MAVLHIRRCSFGTAHSFVKLQNILLAFVLLFLGQVQNGCMLSPLFGFLTLSHIFGWLKFWMGSNGLACTRGFFSFPVLQSFGWGDASALCALTGNCMCACDHIRVHTCLWHSPCISNRPGHKSETERQQTPRCRERFRIWVNWVWMQVIPCLRWDKPWVWCLWALQVMG